MAWRAPIPLLTEEQRSLIRMGWRAPGTPAEGEMEREHAQRIADRSERTGLPINPRKLLFSSDTWLSRLKVAERRARVKKPQLTSGQPLED